MVTAVQKLATAADLAAAEGDRLEVVAGVLVEKAAPSFEHGDVQGAIQELLRPPFLRGRGGPGGWWFASEVEVEFGVNDVFLPDVAGWRRERVSERPQGRPVRHRPDWVCEIVSPSTASRDHVTKQRAYHRAAVPHYWIVDPIARTLLVHRWHAEGYLVVLTATAPDTVRAEPFDAIAIELETLFG
ncbi:hypothetical protein BH09MYX1_BH09MYX1_43020 [soil metagenome]